MTSKYEKEMETSYEKKRPLEVVTVDNGIVHPLDMAQSGAVESRQYGGVTDHEFKFIPVSLTSRVSPPNFSYKFEDWYLGAKPDLVVADIPYLDEDVIFIGAMPKHYGHFILEGLSRLWFFLDRANLKYRSVYISEDTSETFFDFLKYFGLKDVNILRISTPTQFRSVIVPEQSIRLHDYFHGMYRSTIDQIKSNVTPSKYDKVFFSKRESRNQRAVGESSNDAAFVQNGFHIFYPEKMSVYETISVLSGCTTFVATSGTNIHNSMFMDNGTDIICLNRSAHFHPIQIMIDRLRDFNAVYVDTFLFSSKASFGDSPCLIAPTRHLFRFMKSRKIEYRRMDFYRRFPRYLCIFLLLKVKWFLKDSAKNIYRAMMSCNSKPIARIAMAMRRHLGA
jgi:hypothetical protein